MFSYFPSEFTQIWLVYCNESLHNSSRPVEAQPPNTKTQISQLNASSQVQPRALRLSLGLGACSAAVLLARWFHHKAQSGNLAELLFIPGQCLLLRGRGLSVKWLLLGAKTGFGTCVLRYFLPLDFHPRHLACKVKTDMKTKIYRGACTVKDWSNTTACPDQECNNGKYCFHSKYRDHFLITHKLPIDGYSCLSSFSC